MNPALPENCSGLLLGGFAFVPVFRFVAFDEIRQVLEAHGFLFQGMSGQSDVLFCGNNCVASDKVCKLRRAASYSISSCVRSPRVSMRRILAMASRICLAKAARVCS